MAKKTFAGRTFAGRTFAAGTFRGVGPAPAPPAEASGAVPLHLLYEIRERALSAERRRRARRHVAGLLAVADALDL